MSCAIFSLLRAAAEAAIAGPRGCRGAATAPDLAAREQHAEEVSQQRVEHAVGLEDHGLPAVLRHGVLHGLRLTAQAPLPVVAIAAPLEGGGAAGRSLLPPVLHSRCCGAGSRSSWGLLGGTAALQRAVIVVAVRLEIGAVLPLSARAFRRAVEPCARVQLCLGEAVALIRVQDFAWKRGGTAL